MNAISWLRVWFLSFIFCVFVLARIEIHANSMVNHGNSLNKTDLAIVIKVVNIDTQTQISIYE